MSRRGDHLAGTVPVAAPALGAEFAQLGFAGALSERSLDVPSLRDEAARDFELRGDHVVWVVAVQDPGDEFVESNVCLEPVREGSDDGGLRSDRVVDRLG